MKSGNPVLNERAFSQAGTYGSSGAMTIQGAVGKSFILLFLAAATALWTWGQFSNPQSVLNGSLMVWVGAGAIAGFIIAIVTTFKKDWAPVTAPIYAVCEGVFLGGTSFLFNKAYPGIAVEAVALTFGVFFCLLAAYQAGIIRATPTFVRVIVLSTLAIGLFYLVSIVAGFFGVQIPLIHSSGGAGIAFSLLVVTVAALNLVLDFNLIEQASQEGAPKYMEWYSAFALLVTLVWLYIEILRLLSKLSDRK